MENLDKLYAQREAALDRGDATAYNALDAQIMANFAAPILRINTYISFALIAMAFCLIASGILGVI